MSWVTDVNQYRVQEAPSLLEDEEKKRNPRQKFEDKKSQKKKEKMVCAIALLHVKEMLEGSGASRKFSKEHQACELPDSETHKKARDFFPKF